MKVRIGNNYVIILAKGNGEQSFYLRTINKPGNECPAFPERVIVLPARCGNTHTNHSPLLQGIKSFIEAYVRIHSAALQPMHYTPC